MIELGHSLSSEEFGPRELTALATRAETAGFGYALISDHFHPWTEEQGHAPFAWGVIGSIAERTDRLRLGTGATCPLIRTHPAIAPRRRRRPPARCPDASSSASAPGRT